jgi:hypothetical protein
MAGFDRSKVRATTGESIKKREAEVRSRRPIGSGAKAGYHIIDNGDNKFKIFPYHPDGGGESFAECKCVVFLDCKVPKRDSEGKEIEGEYEIKRKPIFNSKIHAGILLDIVDESVLIADNIVIPEVPGKDKDLSTKLLH